MTGISPAIESVIQEMALKYRVETALVKAIIKRESDFRVEAVREEPQINDASIGLMQVLVKTAQWQMNDNNITREMLFNVRFNVEVGTKYIAYQLNRYHDLHKAIAAYNAGSVKYKSDGSFINQPYVDFVYGWYLRYRDEENLVFGPMPAPSSIPTQQTSQDLPEFPGMGIDMKGGGILAVVIAALTALAIAAFNK